MSLLVVFTAACREGLRPDVFGDMGTQGSKASRGGYGGLVKARGVLEYFTYVLGQPYVSIPFPTASLYNSASINETSRNEIPLQ